MEKSNRGFFMAKMSTQKSSKVKNGGQRPGAGRRAGIPNKKTAEKIAALEKSGLMPLDYLLSVMRDTANTQDVRLYAAKNAAPYCHPKLAQIEHTGKNGADLIPVNDPMDTARRVAFLLSQAMNEASNG